MSKKGAAGASSSSSSGYVDCSPHSGFVNLGNTCFLNSVLQATSATQSLKDLYHPQELLDDEAAAAELLRLQAGSNTPSQQNVRLSNEVLTSDMIQQIAARCKSPVLKLANEEYRSTTTSAASSRRPSTVDPSPLSNTALYQPKADEQTGTGTSLASSTRSSLDSKGTYEPNSSDLPLNTAFRHVLEKAWAGEERRNTLDHSKSAGKKAPAVNPKRLLNIMASKYDQYGEYGQQDGHELLRHLLDSLRMEELDVIKKIQPKKPSGARKRRSSATVSSVEDEKMKLEPFVDNLFCGKLLSCVVCEGCRHVSHTYEDFYDVSLSLRQEADAKSAGKRDRMRTMADRWRRATSLKGSEGVTSSSKTAAESLASLTDGLAGSVSDTEEVEEKVKRSSSRAGRGIVRPKSAAAGQNPAMMDANSRESAKTFMMKSLQPNSDYVSANDLDLEKMSLQSEDKKSSQGAVALLRAVSTRNKSTSRGPSPIRDEIKELVDAEGKEKSISQASNFHSHPHHHHFLPHRHERKAKQSKQGAYLAKLLTEAPVPQPLASTSALLWGRRTPIPVPAESTSDIVARHGSDAVDIESQQATTGLVRALHQFTSVEVLDGPNSFACKRCWRILNPPTPVEEVRLRLRRVRRGQESDESERSSDDETSSSEEEEEKEITNGVPRPGIQESSLLPKSLMTKGKPSRPPVNPHADWTKTVTQDMVHQQSVPSIETIEPSSPAQKASPTDATIGTTAAADPPRLQAPKAIPAGSKGLTLGESLSSANSEDGLSDGPEESGDEKRDRSIKFAQQSDETRASSKTISAPLAKGIVRKRAAHSLQRRALKRFLIAETPRVFVFHFKRFQASTRSYGFSNHFKKIDDYVSFPEYLDVKPWLAPPREEYSRDGHLKRSSDPRALAKSRQEEGEEAKDHDHEKRHGRWGWRARTPVREVDREDNRATGLPERRTKYKLYAVVVHQGSMQGGHYTAYVLTDRFVEPGKGRSSEVKAQAQTFSPSPDTGIGKVTPTVGNGSETTTAATGAAAASSSAVEVSPQFSDTSERNISGSASEGVLRSSLSISSLGSTMGASSNGNGNSNVSTGLQTSEAEGSVTSKRSAPSTSPAVSHASSVQRPALSRQTELKKDNRRWVYASDTMVRGASVEEVLKAQAYMLFYEQM